MKPWLKPLLYVVLTALALWLGAGLLRNLNASRNTAAQPQQQDGDGELVTRKHDTKAQGGIMLYGAGLLGCLIGLGLLLSRDVSGWFAAKATDFLYNDNLEGIHDPDYDHAEQVALSGNHLEAVQLLRQFLKKNPREIYAQLRIAELYENDLQNPLAAALEYEEVLKLKFSADRWGWTAIHLVNLYSGKLGKPDQAMAWLNRIATEHPESAPARKARERLGSPEPSVAAAIAEAPNAEPPNNLPPGFSPRKK